MHHLLLSFALSLVTPNSNDGENGLKGGPLSSARLMRVTNRCLLWILARYRVMSAPKVRYSVERIEVYRNGVWIEYTVINTTEKRIFVTPLSINAPLQGMDLRDSHSRVWSVPQFNGCINYLTEDTYISMEPNGKLRFRTQVSTAHKPLELDMEPPKGWRPEKPTELKYFVSSWVRVQSKLSDEGDTSVRVYAIGSGNVPVKWIDKDAPRNRLASERLTVDKN